MTNNRDDAIEMVKSRYEFYRDGYRMYQKALLGSIAANVIFVGVLGWVFTHPPQPVYFATTESGSIIPLVPVNEPLVSDAALLSWVTETVTRAHTYDYANWRQQLQDVSDSFTPAGWSNFQKALVESGNLKAIERKQLVLTAVPSGAPVITARGVLNGSYSWQIEVPILVSYQSSSETLNTPLMVKVLVQRVPTSDSTKGIGIAQFVASERR